MLSDLERVAFNLAFLSRGRIALQAPLDALLDEVRAFSGTVTEMAALMARRGAQTLKRTPLEAGRERGLAPAVRAHGLARGPPVLKAYALISGSASCASNVSDSCQPR